MAGFGEVRTVPGMRLHPPHRDPRPLPAELGRRLCAVLAMVCVAAFVAGCVLLWGGPGGDGTLQLRTPAGATATAPDPVPGPEDRPRLDRLTAAHGCSTDPLPAGTRAARALVVDAAGTVRTVDVATGWAMLEGTETGTLVGFCTR